MDGTGRPGWERCDLGPASRGRSVPEKARAQTPGRVPVPPWALHPLGPLGCDRVPAVPEDPAPPLDLSCAGDPMPSSAALLTALRARVRRPCAPRSPKATRPRCAALELQPWGPAPGVGPKVPVGGAQSPGRPRVAGVRDCGCPCRPRWGHRGRARGAGVHFTRRVEHAVEHPAGGTAQGRHRALGARTPRDQLKSRGSGIRARRRRAGGGASARQLGALCACPCMLASPLPAPFSLGATGSSLLSWCQRRPSRWLAEPVGLSPQPHRLSLRLSPAAGSHCSGAG